MTTATIARAIVTNPARCAADPAIARWAWFSLCAARGIRVVQHRLPPLSGRPCRPAWLDDLRNHGPGGAA